jgi:hypothetical protein
MNQVCLDQTCQLSILIVTCNRREDVSRCLDSVMAALPDSMVEILVLDNGSTDGTAEMLCGYPKIQLTCRADNLGLARALTEIIGQAKGQWLLFLDSDTIVPKKSIERLLEFGVQQKRIGAVAPRVRDMNGAVQLTARNFPGAIHGLFGRQTLLSRLWPGNPITRKFLKVQNQKNNQPFRCDWIAFAAALVRRKALEDAGALDPGFFVYWVDADFFRRVANTGWEVWCCPDVEITHMEHNRSSKVRHPRAIRDFHYGAFRYFYKHHGWRGFNPLLWVAGAALIIRASLQLTVNQWRILRGKA